MVEDCNSNEKVEIYARKVRPKNFPKLENVVMGELALVPNEKPTKAEIPED